MANINVICELLSITINDLNAGHNLDKQYDVLCKYYTSDEVNSIIDRLINDNVNIFIKYRRNYNIRCLNKVNLYSAVINNIGKLSQDSIGILLYNGQSWFNHTEFIGLIQNINLNDFISLTNIHVGMLSGIISKYGITSIIDKIDDIDDLLLVINTSNSCLFQIFEYYYNAKNITYTNVTVTKAVYNILNKKPSVELLYIMLYSINLLISIVNDEDKLIHLFIKLINHVDALINKVTTYNNYIKLFYYLHRYESFVSHINADKYLVGLYKYDSIGLSKGFIYTITHSQAYSLDILTTILSNQIKYIDITYCKATKSTRKNLQMLLPISLLYKCSYDIISIVSNIIDKHENKSFVDPDTLYNIKYLASNKECNVCFEETTKLYIPPMSSSTQIHSCTFVYCTECKNNIGPICTACKQPFA